MSGVSCRKCKRKTPRSRRVLGNGETVVVDARITKLPILILYPHSRCNCRCVMCDIWKVTDSQEISEADLLRHLDDIERLGVEQVVFSGGEPLMHSDLFRLAALLRERSVTTTLLTTGLLLERDADNVGESIDEVIVSLDGPAAIHDDIRRVPNAFYTMAAGVSCLTERFSTPVHARCTVQRRNREALCDTVESAGIIGVDSISFLAADLTSEAFNRPAELPADRQTDFAPNVDELQELEEEIETLISEYEDDIADGFIREDAGKLRRIVKHFRAHHGLEVPVAPRCNAPWVSAVVESDGTVRPCFFHKPIGNARDGLAAALNSSAALSFREGLDVASNPVCRRCVCSLHYEAPRSRDREGAVARVSDR